MTVWIVIGLICVVTLIAEAFLIIPDKLALHRKKDENHGKR